MKTSRRSPLRSAGHSSPRKRHINKTQTKQIKFLVDVKTLARRLKHISEKRHADVIFLYLSEQRLETEKGSEDRTERLVCWHAYRLQTGISSPGRGPLCVPAGLHSQEIYPKASLWATYLQIFISIWCTRVRNILNEELNIRSCVDTERVQKETRCLVNWWWCFFFFFSAGRCFQRESTHSDRRRCRVWSWETVQRRIWLRRSIRKDGETSSLHPRLGRQSNGFAWDER